jgi:hypothetical protein
MRSVYLLLMILFTAISCAGLPGPVPIERPLSLDVDDNRCKIPFPDRAGQFVHSIRAAMPGGHEAVMIGVTAVFPETGTIECVMMTIEGLVLFDARYDGRMTIHRAMPPFDSMDFARGLIEDIQLIFFPPDGPLIASGIADDGAFVCRYRTDRDRTIDIVLQEDHLWEIRQYDSDSRLIRSLKTDPGRRGPAERQDPIPARLKLTAFGPSEYALTLDLIEVRELRE